MTPNELLDLQEVMFRAYVRNVMFVATLPFLPEQMRRDRANGRGAGAADREATP
jgi:hypothetical protein